MRVAYELTALELDRGGTARAIEQTLPLLEADPRVEIERIAHAGNGGRIRRGIAREWIYFPRTLPRRVAKLGVDLLHCPSTLAPPRSPVPLVVTIHDAIGWDHPEWLTRANVAQLTHRLPRAVADGAVVITSSDYSRERLIECLDLDPERIHVVPLGVDPRFTADASEQDDQLVDALGVRKPYLLAVGTLQPRKNLEAALAAFELLAPTYPDLQLAIAGARGWRDDELIARISSSPVADRVHALGRVEEPELIALYRRAEAFVFPSRYEGFGFPPLEAMACGTPVVSTTLTCLAEAIGDAAIPIDPDSPQQIAEAVDSLLNSAELRDEYRRRGFSQAAKFSWEKTVDQTISVYERTLS